MTPVERGLLGLYGGSWLGLIGVSLLSLLRGADVDLLSVEVHGGRWAYLGLSLLSGALLAALPARALAWQVLGLLTVVGLLALAAAGAWPAPRSAVDLSLSLTVLAVVMVGLLLVLKPSAIRRHRPRRAGAGRNPKPRSPVVLPLTMAWSATGLALMLSFTSAWLDPNIGLRQSAAVLLLLIALVALPLLALGHWRPRLAATGLLALAAGALGLPTLAANLLLSLGLLLLSALALAFHSPQGRRS
jgi:hypothetical protein